MKMRISFTKRRLEMLRTPTGERSKIYRDAITRGLGIKLDPSGKRNYFWSRKVGAKASWKTIGEFEQVSLDDARAAAEELNIARKKWKETGTNPLAPASGLTLREIIGEYVERHVRKRTKRPDRAVGTVEGIVDRCLGPLLDRKAADVRRGEIIALREKVHGDRGPSAANQMVQMVRAAINWAIRTELLKGPNAAEAIDMFPEKRRRRFLYKHEIDALAEALSATPNRDLQDFVTIALMTGARKSDVYSMRWTDLSLDDGLWIVPDPKNEEPYTVYLKPTLVERLRARRALVGENQWVFPSGSASGHVGDMKRSWGKLLERADIKDFRQHDMRHTFASWQAMLGTSAFLIGKSLGHKSLASTARYMDSDMGPMRIAVDAATDAMFAPTPKPKLLPPAKKTARRA